jgi:hypothetical protein
VSSIWRRKLHKASISETDAEWKLFIGSSISGRQLTVALSPVQESPEKHLSKRDYSPLADCCNGLR